MGELFLKELSEGGVAAVRFLELLQGFFLVFLRYLNNLMIFCKVRGLTEGSKFDIEQFLFCD